MPDWYRVAKVALYWGMPPQDVLSMSVFWVDAAIHIIEAENTVREQREKERQKKVGAPHGRGKRSR